MNTTVLSTRSSRPAESTESTGTVGGTARAAGAWEALRREVAARRLARSQRRRLEHDLSTYTSRADLDDLYAALDRYDDEAAAPVREILARQQVHAA